ncbi:hypothetical protein [Virgibacillus sp. CBA3643]|uniref:hypothetical protein n=1 Tax=Virgibacillus sp. CBA3643 TaxID=2942278 RepID=UPI0035A2AD1B
MPVDKAAFIALHIHTKKIKGGDLPETVRQSAIVKDMIVSFRCSLEVSKRSRTNGERIQFSENNTIVR